MYIALVDATVAIAIIGAVLLAFGIGWFASKKRVDSSLDLYPGIGRRTGPEESRHGRKTNQKYHHTSEGGGSLVPDPNLHVPDRIPNQQLQAILATSLSRSELVTDQTSRLILSEDQSAVISYLQRPAWEHQVVMVIGPAGTGKSTVLHEFSSSITNGMSVRVAPTGIAARNIRGSTIHRFFRLPPQLHPLDGSTVSVQQAGSIALDIFRKLDVLIIDEISMVRSDLLDAVDATLRKNLNDARPFAGKRVVMFGDPLQLEPVVNKTEGEFIAANWDSHFFFDSKVFKKLNPKVFILADVHRQETDAGFVRALNSLRDPEIGGLDLINTRVTGKLNESRAIRLMTTNKAADGVNQAALDSLAGHSHFFAAKVLGEFDETSSNLPCEKLIKLKLGAEVLLVVNGNGFVNGSRGVLTEVNTNGVKVLLEGGNEVDVEPYSWEQIEYHYDKSENKITPNVVGKFIQLPVKLGWAITIHKSQGLTLNSAHVDLGHGAFAHGQAYVGISRVRTLSGLTLASPITRKDIIVNSRVRAFLKRAGATVCPP